MSFMVAVKGGSNGVVEYWPALARHVCSTPLLLLIWHRTMKNSEVGSPGLGQGVLKKNQGTTASFITNTPILHHSGFGVPS